MAHLILTATYVVDTIIPFYRWLFSQHFRAIKELTAKKQSLWEIKENHKQAMLEIKL